MSKNEIPTPHGLEETEKVKEGKVEEVSEATTEETTEPEKVTETKSKAKKAKKAIRFVTMDDGTQANFGVRSNLLSAIDLEEGIITFKISTGKTITWAVKTLKDLTDFQKTVHLYGVMERVKSSLAPVKIDKLEEVITKQIEAIDNGEFNIRSLNTTGEIVLTDLQKAYGLTMSESPTSTDKQHWKEIDKPEVVAEILQVWEGKTAVERGAIKRHPIVGWHLSVLVMNASKDSQSEAVSIESM